MPFGEELVHYFVGAATCAVPGVPAGLDELWRRAGVLPWERLVEPALRLARSGVTMPLAQAKCLAMLAPVMTMREGGPIYAPGGRLLEEGDRLDQPGLVGALEIVSGRGPAHLLRGHDGAGAARADGGARRPRDAGRPRRVPRSRGWSRSRRRTPASAFRLAEGSRSSSTRLQALPPLRDASPADRALALARVLAAPPYSGRTYEHTTNLCGRRPGRECLRPHHEPRARLGRLPPRLRHAPQQHAGRVRPAHRPARARRTDGQHDVADDRARR